MEAIKISAMKEYILFGKFSERDIGNILSHASLMSDTGSRIAYLSGQFLGIEYKEATLIGNEDTPEVFVIDLAGLDCFTFIEYVEAMRLSKSLAEFRKNLIKVRYKSGLIAFRNRNHFFTDWSESNADCIDDITETIGNHKTILMEKILNRKQDGSYFLNGIPPVLHTIRCLPSASIDEDMYANLKTGDYIGICSRSPGLDVSHVGILIQQNDTIVFRHASSQEQYRKVVDQDFRSYIAGKPGLIILRPK
jgi:hypothetical protein